MSQYVTIMSVRYRKRGHAKTRKPSGVNRNKARFTCFYFAFHSICIIFAAKKQAKNKMGNDLNKYIAVAYQLYTIDNGVSELVEESTNDEPFQFISGFGMTLDAFENEITKLATGAEFDFTLQKEDAFGDYEQDRVRDIKKSEFCINGHFDREHIYKDAIVPMRNDDGNIFYARILAVGDEQVKVDLNHPLAGKTLNFKGRIIESRKASNAEIQGLINRMNGGGCCCGEHGDGCCCNHDHDEEEGCCGHHHGHEGCGHHGKKDGGCCHHD